MTTKLTAPISAFELDINAIKRDIAAQLGCDPEKLPVSLDDKLTAETLGVKATTLAVWRSTGRYNLPYIKVGRLVRYRVSDIAEFLISRTTNHTGEVLL
jgi:hypothetical protein